MILRNIRLPLPFPSALYSEKAHDEIFEVHDAVVHVVVRYVYEKGKSWRVILKLWGDNHWEQSKVIRVVVTTLISDDIGQLLTCELYIYTSASDDVNKNHIKAKIYY